jgi:mRNA interferase RelE/StbE
MWRLQYADFVISEGIPRLNRAAKQGIKKAIEAKLAIDPMRFGKPLRHSFHHLRSLRVGDYRVLYKLDHTLMTVSVAAIGHRRDVYED